MGPSRQRMRQTNARIVVGEAHSHIRRHNIETAFWHLCDNSGLHSPQAHTIWGLRARVSAKVAAYNVGNGINRLCGRHDLAPGTLIV